jgi:hypothetical protein
MGAGSFDKLRINSVDKLRTSSNTPETHRPRMNCGWISLTLNLPIWFKFCRYRSNKKSRGQLLSLDFFAFVVRSAGFEPVAYGFEDQDSENSKIL